MRLTPDEALTLLAQAAEYLYAGKIDQARATAAKAVAKQSDLLTAQALLGELMQTEEPAALAQWNAGLPESALKHSDIWYVRGIQARSSQNLKLAAGCFAKAVRLVPEHRRATYQLGQVLAQIGFAHSARFVERAKLQAELGLLLDQILNSRGQNESAIQRAAEVSEQLGRSWEAWAWATTGSRLFPTAAWPLPIIRRLSPQLVDDLPRTILSANLATDVDLNPLVMAAESHSWSGDASSRRPMIGLADSQRSAQAESLPRAVQMIQPATQPPANFRLEDSLASTSSISTVRIHRRPVRACSNKAEAALGRSILITMAGRMCTSLKDRHGRQAKRFRPRPPNIMTRCIAICTDSDFKR